MTSADPRAAVLAELDALGEACSELGLRMATDPGAIDAALVAELHARVKDCSERLRGLMATLPAEGGTGAVGGEDRPA
jgi:hypothetical protein